MRLCRRQYPGSPGPTLPSPAGTLAFLCVPVACTRRLATVSQRIPASKLIKPLRTSSDKPVGESAPPQNPEKPTQDDSTSSSDSDRLFVKPKKVHAQTKIIEQTSNTEKDVPMNEDTQDPPVNSFKSIIF